MSETIININGDNNNVNNAGNDINQNALTIQQGSRRASSTINVKEGLKKFGLEDAYHWLFVIKMNGKNITAPQLHKQYVRFNDNAWTKTILNYINIEATKAIASEVRYEFLYKEPNVSNLHTQTALIFTKDTIQFEYTKYNSKNLQTNFGSELLPSLLLLYFCETLYDGDYNINIDVHIETTTYGELHFNKMGDNFIKIIADWNTYTLSEEKHPITEKITDFKNATMIRILERVAEGYSSISKTNPFLTIDSDVQDQTLDIIKNTAFKQYRNW